MNFIVRSAREEDAPQLFNLARQFSLLNLPANKKAISEKIDRSIKSFAGDIPEIEREYLFVTEDIEGNKIAGCSQIKTKHGTENKPTYSFKIIKKERFSRDLGIGFIHQILRLQICTDGPTEIGGLVVDQGYRRRPEKVGKLTSLARFLYIGLESEKFQDELLAEMAPPLTEEGRSEFWEALGRRFTGMPYQEADALSHQNKEFIRSLFPEEDIYLCLLDSQARLVLGRVNTETQGALHLLESLGFIYKDEVDPFDGGPHLGVKTQEVSLIKNAKRYRIQDKESAEFAGEALVATTGKNDFRCGLTAFDFSGEDIVLPPNTLKALRLKQGDEIYCSIIKNRKA